MLLFHALPIYEGVEVCLFNGGSHIYWLFWIFVCQSGNQLSFSWLSLMLFRKYNNIVFIDHKERALPEEYDLKFEQEEVNQGKERI